MSRTRACRRPHEALLASVLAAALVLVGFALFDTPATADQTPTSDRESRMGCTLGGPPDETRVENLGPGVSGFPTNMAERIGDTLYVFTLGLSPSRFVAYDLQTQEVSETVEVPSGARTWATVADGTDLYFGQWGSAGPPENFYRYDTEAGELEGLAELDTEGEFWDLAVGPDDRIYAGTRKDGVLHAYDPVSDEIEEIELDGVSGQITGVSDGGDRLYVSTGRGTASLHEVDAETFETTDISPPELGDATGVYLDIAVTDDHVAVGLQSEPAEFVVVDRDDPDTYEAVVVDEEESIIGAVTAVGDDLYFAGITSGDLYRYDTSAGEAERVATPMDSVPTRAMFAEEDRLYGASAPGIIWEYGIDDGDVDHIDLVEAGAEGDTEQPQSLAVAPSGAFVGSNNAFQINPLDGEGDSERIPVAGEPKDMIAVGEDVYMALYPNGLLWRYSGESGEVEQVADWRDIQNRPVSTDYHAELDRVLVTISSDFGAGGALASYDRATEEVDLFERPFGTDEAVESVTPWEDKAVIGGRSAGTVALIDPVDGEVAWQTVPQAGEGAVRDLAVRGDVVHGKTAGGTMFTLDPATGEVLDLAQGALADESQEMLVHDRHLYVATTDDLVKTSATGARADFDNFETVAGDLGVSWHGAQYLRRAPDCSLILFEDRDLLRVSDDNRPADSRGR